MELTVISECDVVINVISKREARMRNFISNNPFNSDEATRARQKRDKTSNFQTMCIGIPRCEVSLLRSNQNNHTDTIKLDFAGIDGPMEINEMNPTALNGSLSEREEVMDDGPEPFEDMLGAIPDDVLSGTATKSDDQSEAVIKEDVKRIRKQSLKAKESKDSEAFILRPYTCHLCTKAFRKPCELNVHIKRHLGEKNVPCDQCDKKFVSRRDLANHKAIHSDVKKFACPICDKKLKRKKDLDRHIQNHSGDKDFECEICGLGFVRRDKMEQHMKVHKNERDFICEHCGKGFFSQSALRVHVNIHTKKKFFPCDFCDRTFPNKSIKDRHVMCHTGDKPYVCETCGFRTADSHTLKSHRYRHLPNLADARKNEKEYKCDICQKVFLKQYRLVRHRKIHFKMSSDGQNASSRSPMQATEVSMETFEQEDRNAIVAISASNILFGNNLSFVQEQVVQTT